MPIQPLKLKWKMEGGRERQHRIEEIEGRENGSDRKRFGLGCVHVCVFFMLFLLC